MIPAAATTVRLPSAPCLWLGRWLAAWVLALSPANAGVSQSSGYTEGEVLVGFKPGTAAETIRQCHQAHGVAVVRTFSTISRIQGRTIQQLHSGSATTADLVAGLLEEPAVAWAEPNFHCQLAGMPAPNDPGFPRQWALENTGQPVNNIHGTPGADIGFLNAWRMANPTTPETVIALLDTGIDLTHLELTPALWTNPGEIPWDGLDNDANGNIDDVHGFNFTDHNGNPSDVNPTISHGTHLAGIMAAAIRNSQGIAGTAFTSRIMPLRITSANGVPDIGNAVAAINYAVLMKTRGVNLVAINASFTHAFYSATEQAAIQTAATAGIVVCTAAGNEGADNTAIPIYPANLRLPNMIVVAASDSADELASYSNYGTKVDLAAPGDTIYSTKTVWPTADGVISTLTREDAAYTASPVLFSGTTTGVTGSLHNCGYGMFPSDFPAAVNGNVALIQRGNGTYAAKVLNAIKAGANGVVIYNNVATPTSPTLSSADAWIPGVFISQADGQVLLASLPATVTLTNLPANTWDAYFYASGTSVAAPFVTAAVAFAAAHFPNESVTQRVARILDHTTPVGTLTGRVRTGGRLDLTGIIDTDRDQLPDWWETAHFDNLAQPAESDPDGDGFTNLQEYRIATLPTDATSHLRISHSGILENGAVRDFEITFPTALDVLYRVEYRPSLSSGCWLPLGADLPGTGTPATVIDPGSPTLPARRFYRVRILSP